ncbi:hypothetical protein EJ110_NYTH21350 [Nymphaea thermarum]|nr:hypothetical protein EJ110_NYTH21350 [Nymphaea thermarum]
MGLLAGTKTHCPIKHMTSPFFMLASYLPQVDEVDTSPEVAFNIFNSDTTKGLLQDSIQKLQLFDISYKQKHEIYVHQTSCAICLQDFTEGDAARRLPKCKHTFHVGT